MVFSKKVLEVTKIYFGIVLIVTNDFTWHNMIQHPKCSSMHSVKLF